MSLQLHHVDLGGAGKPPLIVLHGLLGSSRNWLSTGRDLARHYHVHALDARNHGRSPHAAEMTYEAMMGDILGWMDAQGLARAQHFSWERCARETLAAYAAALSA